MNMKAPPSETAPPEAPLLSEDPEDGEPPHPDHLDSWYVVPSGSKTGVFHYE